MAFKMKGMSFGEGTGYQSPQKIAAQKIEAQKSSHKKGRLSKALNPNAPTNMNYDDSSQNYGTSESPQKIKKKIAEKVITPIVTKGKNLYNKLTKPKTTPQAVPPKLDD